MRRYMHAINVFSLSSINFKGNIIGDEAILSMPSFHYIQDVEVFAGGDVAADQPFVFHRSVMIVPVSLLLLLL
jgi:hypothetical protein